MEHSTRERTRVCLRRGSAVALLLAFATATLGHAAPITVTNSLRTLQEESALQQRVLEAKRLEAEKRSQQPQAALSYAKYSDAELTELGTQWEQLSIAQRRALLAEVKLLMARDRGRSGVLKIRTTRQYGVVRKPDGTTGRLERRVVRLVPARPDGKTPTTVNGESGNQRGAQGHGTARVTFGIGFERRQRKPSEEAKQPVEHNPPVLKASGPKIAPEK